VDEALSVNLSVAGSGSRDVDYALDLTGTAATIPAGETTVKVKLTPVDDQLAEPAESVTLTLTAGNYIIGASQTGTVLIADNDLAPTVQINSPAEGATVGISNVAFTATATDDGAPQPLSLLWTKVSGPGSVTFTAATAANTSASFSAPGAYVLRLTTSDGGSQAFDDIAITVHSPLAQWKVDKFGSNSSDPAISGNSADPDRDGWSNLLEYVLGLEPLAYSANPLQVTLETFEGQRHLTLDLPRNPAATDVTLQVEVSGALELNDSWSASETTIEVDTPERLRVRDNATVESAAKRQIRLKVTVP